MRVSTAFNRILQVPGAWVDTVELTSDGMSQIARDEVLAALT